MESSYIDKQQENQSKAHSKEETGSSKKAVTTSAIQLADNRPEANTAKNLHQLANSFSNPHIYQLKALQEKADNSPRVKQLKTLQEKANNSPQVQHALQLQAKADQFVAKNSVIQKKENQTGLPDQLKSGVENLSGLSMDDVKVHYNSSRPAQLQAHAYAEGTDIHIASGQEKHLPHEAWHVVQQKQGRVQPTVQKKGVNINDDAGLEQEADAMGQKALQVGSTGAGDDKPSENNGGDDNIVFAGKDKTVQRKVIQLQWNVDEELGKAQNKKNDAIGKITSSKYEEAYDSYVKIREIMVDIYSRRAKGTPGIFRRHTDQINEYLIEVINSFYNTLQTNLADYENYYRGLLTKYNTEYNQLYDEIASKLNSKDSPENIEDLANRLKGFITQHLQDFKKKKKSVDDIIMFNKEKIIPDKLVSYDNGRGGNEGVQYSTVPDTKLKPINVEPIRRLGQKNLELYNQSRSHHEEVDKSNKDPENDALREGTALLLLAGSNERKEQIANLMANDVAKQIAIFTQINKHHRSDDIADATALLQTIGLDNLNEALRLIDVVASKGSIREIKLFFDSTRAVTGNPDISELCDFLTDLEYSSLTNLSSFVKEAGKLATLEGMKPVWAVVNTKNNLTSVLTIFNEGIIPDPLKESAMEIALAFANKTGTGNAEDWSKLLQVKDWELEHLIALALAFEANPNNLTAKQWAETAEKHPELKSKPEEVGATCYLNKYANDEWYDNINYSKLSSTDRSKKKYTQLLYALLGDKDLTGLGTIDFNNIQGDFLSMLVFFHRHIATFNSQQGQGFDREGDGQGKYARSNKDHPLNEHYKELLKDESINVSNLLQPLNSSLLNLEDGGELSKDNRDRNQSSYKGTTYHTGKISIASAGLPSHNLKILQDQQSIVSQSRDKTKAKKKLFDAPTLTTAPNQSRTLDSKSTVLDGVVKSQKTALSGEILNDNSYNNNFHDSMLGDRGKLVNRLSTVINSISGGSKVMHAIGSEGHPSLILHVPRPVKGEYYYNNTIYGTTKEIVGLMVQDFNAASGQNVKLTVRGSFGFQRPTLADTGDSVRLWPGYAPVESLLPGLKVLVEKLNSKTTPSTTEMTNMDQLTGLTSPGNEPVLYVESLKTAMRHAFIALNKKISDTATPEKKRVYDWLRTRMLIKLKQSGILLSKAKVLYSNSSTASQADKDKHFLVTADMTDKLQEYTMLYTATTLDNTTNPNQNHTETGKFKDGNDVYEKKLKSILNPTDYRIYYLDSGEQALITAGILANRFQQGKDETDIDVPGSCYYNINPYFEIGEFNGDKRSNLKKDNNNNTSKIVHTDLSPVITKDRTTPKPKTDILNDTKGTWQDLSTGNVRIGREDVIPIIDITNSSLSEVANLGKMPNNFIIVESLTKHQQLGADKFIMGRLIAVSKTQGTQGNTPLSKSNFLDLSQKIVGPVANEAYNPLLAQIRSNMDKALYTNDID